MDRKVEKRQNMPYLSLFVFAIGMIFISGCAKGEISTAYREAELTHETFARASESELTDKGYPSIRNSQPDVEEFIYEIVNEERSKRGLSDLEYSTEMEYIARIHCRNMIDEDFFDHTDHLGRSPFDRMDEYLPNLSWCSAGENIAYNYGNTPEEVARNLMNAWMNSTGHRENILDSGYTYIGIGVVESGGYYYSSQNFYSDCGY